MPILPFLAAAPLVLTLLAAAPFGPLPRDFVRAVGDPVTAAAMVQAARVAGWRADLRVLARELPARHVNLFATLRREDFDRAVAELDRALPDLDDGESLMALTRVGAMADAHTGVRWQGLAAVLLHQYPLAFWRFSDGLHVVAARRGHERALGARVVRIAGLDADSACAAIAHLVPHDNEAWRDAQVPELLDVEEALRVAGVVRDTGACAFVLRDSSGREFTETVRSRPLSDDAGWVPALGAARSTGALAGRNAELNYWCEYLPDSRTLYFRYNRCAPIDTLPFAEFSRRFFALLDGRGAGRVVIDLRANGGGNSSILDPFIDTLKTRPAIDRRGGLYVLIGRRTFSSGVLNAVRLARETRAILVGGPTGGRPNSYGEVRSFRLPSSRLDVTYCTRYFRPLHGSDPPSLLPEIPAESSWADHLAGRDPALEAALAHDAE